MTDLDEVAKDYVSGLSKTDLELIVKNGVDLGDLGGMEDALERTIVEQAEDELHKAPKMPPCGATHRPHPSGRGKGR